MYKKLQYQLQNSCNLTGQSHESPPMRGEGGQKSLKLNDIISDPPHIGKIPNFKILYIFVLNKNDVSGFFHNQFLLHFQRLNSQNIIHLCNSIFNLHQLQIIHVVFLYLL